MLRWCALALVALLVLLPGVQACPRVAAAEIDLEFPAKPGCATATPDGCPPVPEADEPLVLHGELVWSWTFDSVCAGAALPSPSPVHVSFESIAYSAHGWLAITTQPREIFIPPEEQWDVTDDGSDPSGGTYRSEERYPLALSVSLVGEPSPEALARLASGTGAISLVLRAEAKETATFVASYATQQVVLDGRPAMDPGAARGSPSLPLGLGVAALALVAAALRRPG